MVFGAPPQELVQADHLQQTIDCIEKELQEASTHWSQEEFTQNCTLHIHSLLQAEESCIQIADRIEQNHIKYGQHFSTHTQQKQIKELHLTEVQEAMLLLTKAPKSLLCVGKKDNLLPLSLPFISPPQKYWSTT